KPEVAPEAVRPVKVKPETPLPIPGDDPMPTLPPAVPAQTVNATPATAPAKNIPGGVTDGASGTPVTTSPGAKRPDDVVAAINRCKDTSIPLETRQDEVKKMGKKADSQSLKLLTAIGDERIYLNWSAVEAIGSFVDSPEKPAAAAYLKTKLSSDDSQIMCAAVRAYATLLSKDGIPDLASALKGNHERPDGHQEIVCSAIVKAMGEIGSTDAIPALKGEIERSEEKGWSLEYGSKLVEAMTPSHMNTAEARAAMAAYANRLEARKPADKMAKAYFEAKIAEARKAAHVDTPQ
ncbi:MAG: hypothetical protein C0404_00980, partial [Verrucomicrobia bacterium]|nr:hypothetical protein [Verrucomicrobiota bacterium]